MSKKLSPKAVDKLISKIYYAHCHGMSINMLRIPVLFREARELVAAGYSEAAIGSAMVAFVRAGQ
jgi:hypothetical protein